MSFDEWAFQVDALCRHHLKCSWLDLCGDMQPLMSAFYDSLTPHEFVDWWAEKYDLDWFNDGSMLI